MKGKLIPSIALLVATVIIFLLFLEIGARIFVVFSPKFMCSTFSNLDDENLCQLEYKLPRNFWQGQNSTAYSGEFCDMPDTELGWVPSQNCRTQLYSTNSQGFRGLKEFSIAKNRTRIIFVGDSFTWGEANYDNTTFTYYLDKSFNGSADIINMGVRGYGPDQAYLYFMRNGLKYKPDIVVFGLFMPDIHRTILSVRDYYKPRFILVGGELKLDKASLKIPDLKTASAKSSEVKKKARLYSFSYFYGLFKKFWRLETAYSHESGLTLNIIDEMNEQLGKEGIKLVVLLIPEQEMVEKNNDDYYGALPKIITGLENNRIGYINLQPLFKAEFQKSNQSLYRPHLKPAGNLIVARELFHELRKK